MGQTPWSAADAEPPEAAGIANETLEGNVERFKVISGGLERLKHEFEAFRPDADAEVAVEIGLGAVEVEITDGQAAQVAADARVDGFADDPVHAGKRADVDDAGRAFLG